ncbi:MAG: hypothetical protein WKG07_05890 [Hymenobacter sp.]
MQRQFGPAYLLPEGGTNALALRGVAELIGELRQHVDFDAASRSGGHWRHPGRPRPGLGRGCLPARAVGIAALKGADFLRADVDALLTTGWRARPATMSCTRAITSAATPSYSAELRAFIQQFETDYGVLLDPIYTGKLLFGVLDLIGKGYFGPGSTVVAVHTGGLQAWAGFYSYQ